MGYFVCSRIVARKAAGKIPSAPPPSMARIRRMVIGGACLGARGILGLGGG